MKTVSIFDKKWIDLVFENKNQSYGAYQLRQESGRTTFKAFVLGLIFLSASVWLLSSFANAAPIDKPIEPDSGPIVVTAILPIKPPKTEVIPATTEKPKKNIDKPLINPVITDASQAQDVAINKAPSNPNGSETGTSTAIIPDNSGSGTSTNVVIEKTPVIDNTPEITAVLDRQPEFPGGIKKFYDYVGKKFERPEIDNEANIRVYVSFIIETNGEMSSIKVLNNPGFGLDKEAIRVLKSLKTNWEPGYKDGKPVRVLYNLPITIKKE